MVLFVEFITWFPFTEATALSTEAESVGVYKAEASFVLKFKLKKEIRNPAPTTKMFFNKNNLEECDFWPCI